LIRQEAALTADVTVSSIALERVRVLPNGAPLVIYNFPCEVDPSLNAPILARSCSSTLWLLMGLAITDPTASTSSVLVLLFLFGSLILFWKHDTPEKKRVQSFGLSFLVFFFLLLLLSSFFFHLSSFVFHLLLVSIMSHFSGQSWSFAPRTAEPTQEEKESLLASLPSHKDISLKCPMCSGTLTDPRTLPCLHSFCLACLEAQVETDLSSIPAPAPAPAPALVVRSFNLGVFPPAPAALALCCHQCKAPFTVPSTGGVKSFECITFIDSLAKAQKDTGTGW